MVHRVSTGQVWRKGRGPRGGRHNASWEVCIGSNGSKECHGAPHFYGGAVSTRPNPHRCSVNVETFGYVIQRRLHRDYYAPSIVKIPLACGHLILCLSKKSCPRKDNSTRFLREVFCYWKMMLMERTYILIRYENSNEFEVVGRNGKCSETYSIRDVNWIFVKFLLFFYIGKITVIFFIKSEYCRIDYNK